MAALAPAGSATGLARAGRYTGRRMDGPGGTRGEGRLAVELVDGASAAVGWRAGDPLKLMLPRPRGPAVWACAATYGGGLVAGDRIGLDLAVGAGAALFVGTQSTTKVFRSDDGAEAAMRTTARVATSGLLASLPEPVSCFAGSRYRQEADLDLDPGASLAWLDAVNAGRVARGESWQLASCRTTTRLRVGGRLAARDALRLDPSHPVAPRLAGIASLASLFLIGPRCAAAAAAAQAVVQARQPGADGLWLTASPLADGCLLRGAAATHQALAACLRLAIQPLADELGGDPWRRLASVEVPCT